MLEVIQIDNDNPTSIQICGDAVHTLLQKYLIIDIHL